VMRRPVFRIAGNESAVLFWDYSEKRAM